MDFSLLFLSVFLLLSAYGNVDAATVVPFEQNYEKYWGIGHINFLNQNKEVQIYIDKAAGGAGFQSLQKYGSGFFRMRIKTPPKDNTNIITTYYLNSTISDTRDEIDFEFIFNDHKQHILHTNLFIGGQGGREVGISLWFDPSADFHTYALLWNQHQLVWFVDDTPIRVFKNNTNIGGSYPTQPSKIVASIWSGSVWPSPGEEPHWGDGPFQANYQGFGIDGCATQSIPSDPQCYASNYWWNQEKYWKLDSTQQAKYEQVTSKFVVYDFCSNIPPSPECKN